jgi:hypothetical protein
MAEPRVDWKYLVNEVNQHPVQGILVDPSTSPVSIRILCKDSPEWIEDVSLRQVQRLTDCGKLPGHVVTYLTRSGLISR